MTGFAKKSAVILLAIAAAAGIYAYSHSGVPADRVSANVAVPKATVRVASQAKRTSAANTATAKPATKKPTTKKPTSTPRRVTATPAPTHAGTAKPSTTYILNTSTKKIHRTTCAYAKKIAEKNYREFTGSIQTLLDQGYSKCGHCSPK